MTLLDPQTQVTVARESYSPGPVAGVVLPKLAAGLLATTLAWGVTEGPPVSRPVRSAIADMGWTSAVPVLRPPAALGRVVRGLKERSGLSWQQLADAFGVTPRSLHFWVNGGNMSGEHVARLNQLSAYVDHFDNGEPQHVRTALTLPRSAGRSILAELVESARPRTLGGQSSPSTRLSNVEASGRYAGRLVKAEGVPLQIEDI